MPVFAEPAQFEMTDSRLIFIEFDLFRFEKERRQVDGETIQQYQTFYKQIHDSVIRKCFIHCIICESLPSEPRIRWLVSKVTEVLWGDRDHWPNRVLCPIDDHHGVAQLLRCLNILIKKRIANGVVFVTRSFDDKLFFHEQIRRQVLDTLPSNSVLCVEFGNRNERETPSCPDLRVFSYQEHASELQTILLALGATKPPRTDMAMSGRGHDTVFFGASTPRRLKAGDQFVARFAVYTEFCRGDVQRVIHDESPLSHARWDSAKCRWRPGTLVSVNLSAAHIAVCNPNQTFRWNGKWEVLRFDAQVVDTIEVESTVFRFDIVVEGLPLVALRPEVQFVKVNEYANTQDTPELTQKESPRTAFASYARKDRSEVLRRVRSLQIFTGVEVFVDCLSIRPGEQWKKVIAQEILNREMFLLFWSRNAKKSKWVDWELKHALSCKERDAIQPHPLESAEVATPPAELGEFQFGAMYEFYLASSLEITESIVVERLRDYESLMNEGLISKREYTDLKKKLLQRYC
jgi:hypothetical protein